LNEQERVNDYLRLVKETIQNPVIEPSWRLVLRPENKECISQLGYTLQDVKETLLGLSVDDYSEGPCQDRDEKGDLWVFGKVIDNRTVYIKVKVASLRPLRIVRVISFHFANFPINYPLK
jgi:hypothetical protein